MKTTLIFSTLIFLTALMGCSDNMNVTDPLNQHNYASGQLNRQTVSGTHDDNWELVWTLDQLSVKAVWEGKVENSANYTRPPGADEGSYLITFDGYTNADNIAYPYLPLAQIWVGREMVFQVNNLDGVNEHNEITLGSRQFDNISFYIALNRIEDTDSQSEPSRTIDACFLKLSNINIFRLN